ncbi:3964_t:CDS:2, partial [Acaulospora colombiana]
EGSSDEACHPADSEWSWRIARLCGSTVESKLVSREMPVALHGNCRGADLSSAEIS